MPGKHTQTAINQHNQQALERALERRTGAKITGWSGNDARVRERGDQLSMVGILLATRVEEDGSWWAGIGPLCGFLANAPTPPAYASA